MKILFICTGNICRSPTAEGVFRSLIEQRKLGDDIVCDSAGTAGYHIGDPPDPRTIKHAAKRGYDLSPLRARLVTPNDFVRFDLVLAMDDANRRALSALSTPAHRSRLRMFLEFHPGSSGNEVPDPYYGGPEDFERVLDLVEAGSEGLLDAIASRQV